MATESFNTYDPELATLLRQAKAIRPDVRFVILELSFGDMNNPQQFWAHSDLKSWCGDTPEELIADILASLSLEAA